MGDRNKHIITIDVEFDRPIPDSVGEAAGDLLASDVQNFLKNEEWGYGRARIEAVYAPRAQFGVFT